MWSYTISGGSWLRRVIGPQVAPWSVDAEYMTSIPLVLWLRSSVHAAYRRLLLVGSVAADMMEKKRQVSLGRGGVGGWYMVATVMGWLHETPPLVDLTTL